MLDVSVVIPALNEAATIEAVVRSVAGAPWAGEILVIDDGSSDETAARATAAGARVLFHRRRRGNGACVRTALRSASKDWLLILDADGQHRRDDVDRVMAAGENLDLVVAA